jgi:apolipoprotein N-acyltransferase
VALVRSRTAQEPPLTTRRAFTLGLLSGAVYFTFTLYWLVETMTTFGGLQPAVAAFAALLLVAYLSLFPAGFAVAVARMSRAFGPEALLLAAPVWVATELGRQYVWDGFPWELLGYSQITWLPIAQLASVTGVYGLSLLLALTGASAAYLLVRRGSRRRIVGTGVAALVIAIGLWGGWRLHDSITESYLSMSRQALGQGATFVIWPESSTPFYFEHDLLRGGAIRRLAREGKATFLIGSDQVEPVRAAPGLPRPEARTYNAAFLVKPDGQIGAVYRKMHLVPFGEYVPLQRLLFFVKPIVEAVSDFAPGT